MVIYRECPVCNSWKISLHLVCKDYLASGKTFQLYRCASCETVFTQDHPGETEMAGYYASPGYISHSDTSEGFTNKLYKVVRGIMLERKRKIVQKESGIEKGVLLDIGCGTGYFAGFMKKSGWDLTGIEIDEKARRFATSHFGLRVIPPGEISYLPSATFDCITLWHVLEHFHDPLRYFSEISRLLKPGGLCLVALPNCSSSDALHYREFWAAYDVPRHIWHFPPTSFNAFLQKTDFRCTGIRNLPFDSFYIPVMSEKYKGAKLPFLQGMIKGMIFFLRSLTDIRKSSSLIYTLKRR